jgi:cytosine/uracil/thiamine/allantoin permease
VKNWLQTLLSQLELVPLHIGSLLVAPTIGVMLADFWVVAKRKVDVPSLFRVPPRDWAADPEWETRQQEDNAHKYWYQNGVHLWAVVSIAVGAMPNLWSLFKGIADMTAAGG